MRLSEWSGRAPTKEALSAKVTAVIMPVLAAMGADAASSCWIVWGDDPAVRYTILVPTAAGLVQVHVRVNVPQEGPRAAGKLIRWSRVQTGELAAEMAAGHRFLSFQVESLVIRGTDDEADGIGAFALELFAAMDGRGSAIGAAPAQATRQGSTPEPRQLRGPRESSR